MSCTEVRSLQRSDRCGQKTEVDRTGKLKRGTDTECTGESSAVYIAECGPCAGVI
jgi:hypothetical protein